MFKTLRISELHRTLALPLVRSEAAMIVALHLVVGLLAGLGAVAFHDALDTTGRVLQALYNAGPYSILGSGGEIVLPIAGALMAAALIWLFARHDRTHGTSAVVEAVALRGGRLPIRPLLVKVLGAAIFIGSGASAGPEDPAVQLGAVAGSWLGQRLRLSDERIRSLVASGVAGAIAAAFNAPIAGVFFALEIVVGEFSTTLFAPVVLAAVVASSVSRALLGDRPAFFVPPYALVNPGVELPLYAVLGIPAAIVGVLFIKALFGIEDHISHDRPIWLRAVAVGGVTGIVGLVLPGVLGVGYNVVGQTLVGAVDDPRQIAAMLAGKLLLTAFCVAGMGIGGTFAPSLFLGAMLGELFGVTAHALLPGLTASPEAYALVGMGAVLTAVVRAPITSVLLLFEVTNDYRIILPIMLSVAVTSVLAHWLFPESLYTERLARRGINLRFGRDLNIMELVRVGDAMNRKCPTLGTETTLREAIDQFTATHYQGLPVLNEQGELSGLITYRDISHALETGRSDRTKVAEVMSRDLVVAYPDQSLNDVMRLFASRDIGRLPIVDRSNPRRLLGLLRRHDLARAYNLGVLRRAELEQRIQEMKLRSESGTELLEVPIERDSPLVGRNVRNLALPEDVLLATIQRGSESLLPRPGSVIKAGDRLVFLVTPESLERLRAALRAPQPAEEEPRYHRFVITPGTSAIGQPIKRLNLPPGALVVAIRRLDHILVPRGDTLLEAGDEVTVLTERDSVERAVEPLFGPEKG